MCECVLRLYCAVVSSTATSTIALSRHQTFYSTTTIMRYYHNHLNLLLVLLTTSTWITSQVMSLKIYNIIPTYCGSTLEILPADQLKKDIKLTDSGDGSFIHAGAAVIKDLDITPNYKCRIVFTSPPGRGLVLTVKKASLNANDTITFRSGTNPVRVWKEKQNDESGGLMEEEIVTVASRQNPASITVDYEPTVGKSQYNAGFEMAVTVYRAKENGCVEGEFDCQNDRCVGEKMQCDGYNSCGNNQDESGCSGVSWLIVAILIVVAVFVVVLAILVWVRMSKG